MSSNSCRGIWVFAEQRGGELHGVSLELLGKANELAQGIGCEVAAVLLGHNITSYAKTLISHGADIVLVADDPLLNHYRVLPYSYVIEYLIKEYQPEVLLMGATAMGVELAPRVAAKLKTGLSAHCIDLKLDREGKLLQVVPGWEGGVIATIACPAHRPQMATVMPGIMRALSPTEKTGQIIEVKVSLTDKNLGPEVLEVKTEKPAGRPLEQAEIVVAGGWGVGNEEGWKTIEQLADVLGGSVGATRPAVDEGWVEEGQMIGQSGKTVRPTLYIAVGISGVMHHVVGMDQAKEIISINTDANADIFEVSDVIVVEDFKKVVPKLIKEIEARQKVCK